MAKFVLIKDYKYWWPVRVSIPHPSEVGESVEYTFTARFQAVRTEDASARYTEISTGQVDMLAGNEVLREAILDWQDVLDEEGKPVEFSPESLSELMNNVWALSGLWRAWMQSMSGVPAPISAR